MKKDKKTNTNAALLLGIFLGLLVAGYAYKYRNLHDELMAFKLMFFPMLITLGVAATTNALLWYFVGRRKLGGDAGGRSFRGMSEILLVEYQGSWLSSLYRFLWWASMFGAGYVSTTPVTAISLV